MEKATLGAINWAGMLASRIETERVQAATDAAQEEVGQFVDMQLHELVAKISHELYKTMDYETDAERVLFAKAIVDRLLESKLAFTPKQVQHLLLISLLAADQVSGTCCIGEQTRAVPIAYPNTPARTKILTPHCTPQKMPASAAPAGHPVAWKTPPRGIPRGFVASPGREAEVPNRWKRQRFARQLSNLLLASPDLLIAYPEFKDLILPEQSAEEELSILTAISVEALEVAESLARGDLAKREESQSRAIFDEAANKEAIATAQALVASINTLTTVDGTMHAGNVVAVSGDGNCLFHSLARLGLHLSRENFIELVKKLYAKHIAGKSLSEHESNLLEIIQGILGDSLFIIGVDNTAEAWGNYFGTPLADGTYPHAPLSVGAFVAAYFGVNIVFANVPEQTGQLGFVQMPAASFGPHAGGAVSEEAQTYYLGFVPYAVYQTQSLVGHSNHIVPFFQHALVVHDAPAVAAPLPPAAIPLPPSVRQPPPPRAFRGPMFFDKK